MNEPSRAEPLYERALAIQEKAFGPDHMKVARTLNNFGYLLRYLGRYSEARPLLERSVAIYEKALGPEHPDVTMPLTNLGLLLRDMGDNEGARPLLERVWAIDQATRPGHPGNDENASILASVLINLGEFEEAKSLLDSCLENQIRTLGEESSAVAGTLWSQARLYLRLGDRSKADSYLKRSIAILEKVHGPESPNVLFDRACYAVLMGDHDQGLHLLERALDRGFSALRASVSPNLKTLHGDPRFERIMEEAREREERDAKGN
jgi:tetratricopeptide (TPR) repeat protein